MGNMVFQLIPLAVLISLALFARRLQGSWLAPSAFAGLLWSFYLILPLVMNADLISSRTLWLIVALVACIQAGAFFGEDPVLWRSRRIRIEESILQVLGTRMLRLSLLCSAVALVGGVIFVVAQLRESAFSLTLAGLLSFAAGSYGLLWDRAADPWWFRLMIMWIFPAALLGGCSCAVLHSRKEKMLSFCPFIPALLLGIALASRFGTGLSIMCWFGGYLTMKAFGTRGRYALPRRLLITGALAFVAAVGMYVSLGVVRGHDYSDVSEGSALVRSNLWGYLAVFDDWVRNGTDYRLGFGRYTFAGAQELLGIRTRDTALDYEPIILESGVPSNIYTAFRGLIEDFSLPGTFILLMVGGLLAGRAYSNLSVGRISGVATLAGFYVFLLFSPIVSIFNYNSVMLALLVGIFAFRVPKSHRFPVSQGLSRTLHTKVS